MSSVALGPLLLIVSKRRDAPFVVGLIDWRLFENPFLYLEDIEVPVVEVEAKEELFGILPELFDRLMDNLQGTGEDSARDQRLSAPPGGRSMTWKRRRVWSRPARRSNR